MEEEEESALQHSENVLNISKVRKRAKILDSDDSEDERPAVDDVNEAQLSDGNTDSNLSDKSTRKTRLKRINSDSEDEDVFKTKTMNLEDRKGATALIDSDSEDDDNISKAANINLDHLPEIVMDVRNGLSDIEDVVDEEEVTPHNKSFPNEDKAVEAVIYTANEKGELVKENAPLHKPSLASLCDSESEAELDNNIVDATMDEIVQPKIYKRPRRKNPEENPAKMTAQDAAKQRMEIHSESQRMLRESNVSLPYHKPKSYTIKEFLERRSKLSSTLPSLPNAPPSIAMKMSKDQLKEVSKKLNERIKEVEQFYKSESEDEDEEHDGASGPIRSWLDVLVGKAMDEVDEKFKDVASSEEIAEDVDEPSEHHAERYGESLEYEFSLDDINENDSQKINISEIIKDKLNIQPRLSGTADDIIDLEEGVTRLSRVRQLVDKFFQHTAKKVPHKHKVQLNVVEVCSGGEIVQETVSMNVEEEEGPVLVETPGAKLQKLREELQEQMAQKRLELWKRKHEQGDCLTLEKQPDKEGYEDQAEHDILDDEEEEFEMTESESDEEEGEEEEECAAKEKPKIRSAFLHDEADEDDMEAEVENDDEEMEDDGDRVSDYENDGFEADVEEATEKEELQSPRKKILKRIIKPFSLDSDDEEEDQHSQITGSTKLVKYYTADEDDVIPPNLPRVGKTPQRTQLDKSKSEFDFLTPVTYLTGLQNLSSDSKFLQDSPKSPFVVPFSVPESQDSSSQPQSQVPKKLFSEIPNNESQNSQDNLEDLAELCSGTFPPTQNCESSKKSLEQEAAEELPSTQDLLNFCSGDFSTQDVASDTNSPNQELPPTKITEKILIHQIRTIQPSHSSQREIKSLDEEQDQIISQLLDEDELERFKKKFESPVNRTIRKTHGLEDMANVEEANATGFINSDEENEELEVKQKKRKKLVFSDDEESNNDDNDDDDEAEDNDNEEEIDLHDDVDDEEQQLENEIVAQESRGFKINDFLDKEAELSESEWGSADEDEKGLDELEIEEGDQEKFNENKMRSEIEKIQMRQILDEDNREVKLLQELLLEDGELHGTGRKRQFRWKALDSANDGEFAKRDDDDDMFLDEEESEEQYRKMRHKREMFLKKQSSQDDSQSVLSDSEILKLGPVFKSKSQGGTPAANKPAEDVSPLALLNKRGSFLSRSDQVLQRLAEYNKVTGTTVGATAKNSKCFVFQTVEARVKDNNKRKAAEATPKMVKKLRLDDLSPAVGQQGAAKSSRAKKLFGKW